MVTAMASTVSTRVALTLAAVFVLAVPVHGEPEVRTAREVIARAVVERMGDGVTVQVLAVDMPTGTADRFIDALPDPAGRLGRGIRFRLVPAQGSRVFATATLRVVGPYVVTRRGLARGATIAADDVEVVSTEVQHAPLRRLPTGEQVIGSRVLRPVAGGSVVLPGTVAVRRAVEPGDRITAVAIAGDVRVSAELKATDGGEPGEVIRLVNTDTRRTLRGRILREGLVEVGYAR